MNRSLRGRADLLLTRFRPFVGGALIDTRERANAEIDLRADRDEREVLGGFSLELSPITYVFAGVTRSEFTVDEGERYRGVNLAEQLDRRSAAVSIGVRRNLTPLTSVQVVGRVARDRFTRNATRDSAAKHLETIWRFAPDALWHGELSAGFQSFAPDAF